MYVTCIKRVSCLQVYNIMCSGSKGGSYNRLLTNWTIAADNSSVFEIQSRKKNSFQFIYRTCFTLFYSVAWAKTIRSNNIHSNIMDARREITCNRIKRVIKLCRILKALSIILVQTVVFITFYKIWSKFVENCYC